MSKIERLPDGPLLFYRLTLPHEWGVMQLESWSSERRLGLCIDPVG